MEMEIKISSADAEKIIADEIRRRLGNLVSPTQMIEIELPRYGSGEVKITVAAEIEPASIPVLLQEPAEVLRDRLVREDAERMRREEPKPRSLTEGVERGPAIDPGVDMI